MVESEQRCSGRDVACLVGGTKEYAPGTARILFVRKGTSTNRATGGEDAQKCCDEQITGETNKRRSV